MDLGKQNKTLSQDYVIRNHEAIIWHFKSVLVNIPKIIKLERAKNPSDYKNFKSILFLGQIKDTT